MIPSSRAQFGEDSKEPLSGAENAQVTNSHRTEHGTPKERPKPRNYIFPKPQNPPSLQVQKIAFGG